LTKLILYGAIAVFVIFAVKFIKMILDYKSSSRPNVDDLKDRASYLKNKYKNVEEADYRDITSSDEENDSLPKDDA